MDEPANQFLTGEGYQAADLFYGSSSQWPTPEHEMLQEMLKLALADLNVAPATLRQSKYRQRDFDTAANWVMAEATDPFSFEFACEVFGLDASAVRRALQRRYGLKAAFTLRRAVANG